MVGIYYIRNALSRNAFSVYFEIVMYAYQTIFVYYTRIAKINAM